VQAQERSDAHLNGAPAADARGPPYPTRLASWARGTIVRLAPAALLGLKEFKMAWHLRKKPTGIRKIPKVPTMKPIKPLKPIQPIRPIKPIAPLGHEYYWKPDTKA